MLPAFLRAALARHRRALGVVVVLQVVQALALLWLPTLNATLIDDGLVRGDTGYVLQVGALMLVVTLGQVAAGLRVARDGVRVTMAVARDLRAAVFDRVRRLPVLDVERLGVSSLIIRTTNDVTQVEQLLLLVLTTLIVAPVTVAGGILLALRQSVPLSAVLLVTVPVLAVLITVVNRRLRPAFGQVQADLDTMNRVLREQIVGVRVVRAFVRDDGERARFAAVNDDLRGVSVRVGKLMAWLVAAATLTLDLCGVAVVWFGGQLVAGGGLPIGAVTAVLSYVTQILGALVVLGGVVMLLPRAQVSAERIGEVLATPLPTTEQGRRSPTGRRLDVHELEFRYPGAESPALHGVTFSVHPGRVTALIGGTGSGMSTLLGLVAGLFTPTGGSIRIGGIDVRELDREALAAAVGLVPQQPFLFAGTVASNLRLVRPEATDDELWVALRTAQAEMFVRGTDDGLEHTVEQDGANLSGGQCQRLAIARALVRRPALLLLDHAFSALDHVTELRLRAALDDDLPETSVLVAAQRVSSVAEADHIVVLDGGRVVGSGTHDELLAGNRTYQEIARSQDTVPETV